MSNMGWVRGDGVSMMFRETPFPKPECGARHNPYFALYPPDPLSPNSGRKREFRTKITLEFIAIALLRLLLPPELGGEAR